MMARHRLGILGLDHDVAHDPAALRLDLEDEFEEHQGQTLTDN
jgi:hypothetical protein